MRAADLTEAEQVHVRAALRALRFQLGTWESTGRALGFKPEGARKVAHGREGVSARMAFRVARLADVGIDDLLAGRGRFPCPTCGHVAEATSDRACR